MVQSGVHQFLHISWILEAATIGVNARDLTILLGVSDQLGQIRSQRWLAAGEYDMGDADFPEPVQNRFPFTGFQFGVAS